MINIEMAGDYYARAKKCLKEAEMAYEDREDGDAAMTVRRSQEALEPSVKALLRLLGIEYPRERDVSDVILEHRSSLPEEVAAQSDELAGLITELASIRGPALYGYEREGIPANKAFSLNYVEETLNKVGTYVVLIGDIMGKLS